MDVFGDFSLKNRQILLCEVDSGTFLDNFWTVSAGRGGIRFVALGGVGGVYDSYFSLVERDESSSRRGGVFLPK